MKVKDLKSEQMKKSLLIRRGQQGYHEFEQQEAKKILRLTEMQKQHALESFLRKR